VRTAFAGRRNVLDPSQIDPIILVLTRSGFIFTRSGGESVLAVSRHSRPSPNGLIDVSGTAAYHALLARCFNLKEAEATDVGT